MIRSCPSDLNSPQRFKETKCGPQGVIEKFLLTVRVIEVTWSLVWMAELMKLNTEKEEFLWVMGQRSVANLLALGVMNKSCLRSCPTSLVIPTVTGPAC